MQHFRDVGVPVIVISGNAHAKIIPLATHAIIASHDERDFLKVGTFSSQVAFEYILDSLFALLYAKEYQKYCRVKKNKLFWNQGFSQNTRQLKKRGK